MYQDFREDYVVSLLNSYLDLYFDVLRAATGNRYADNNDIRLINPESIALFSIYKLTKKSKKYLEDNSFGHIVSVMYKLITSARGDDEFSIGLDRDCGRRQRQLTNNRNIKGKKHLRTMLKDTFGLAGYQEKGTYGLRYKSTLT